MRGIAYINDDMYYERPDGTYAVMPWTDPQAVAEIIVDRSSPEELLAFLEDLSKIAQKRGLEVPCGHG